MASLNWWDALTRFVSGTLTSAKMNDLEDAVQDEFETRDAFLLGHISVPSLSIDAINDRVNLTAINGLVSGKRVGTTGYWEFNGATPLGADTDYLLYVDDDGTLLTPTTTPNATALYCGSVDWNGAALSNLTPETDTLDDTFHTHANKDDLDLYDNALDRDATALQGVDIDGTDTPNNGEVLTYDSSDSKAKWQVAAAGYTDEKAQDAVGNILTDTDSVNLTYTDAEDKITADVVVDDVTLEVAVGVGVQVKDSGIDTDQLADDAVDKEKIAADVAGDGLGQNVDGSLEVNVGGSLVLDTDAVELDGDEDAPAGDQYYGTDSGGTKGWHALPAGLTEEFVEDTVGAMVADSDTIDATYEDATPDGEVTLEVKYDDVTIILEEGVGLKADNDTAQWNADRLQGIDVNTGTPADGAVMVYDAGDVRWEAQLMDVVDNKQVMVSGNDSTPAYLESKLAAGDGISIATLNDGADEDSQITNSDRGSTAVSTHEGTYSHHQDNDAGAAAPEDTDDTTEGYSVGSRWIDTVAGNTYTCVDATEDAAVWEQENGGGGVAGSESSPNLIDNPEFAVWQRGTSMSAANDVYTADRWVFLGDVSVAPTVEQQTPGINTSTYAGRVLLNSDCPKGGFAQIVESIKSVPYRSRTMQFQARVRHQGAVTVYWAVLGWKSTADSVTSDFVADWSDGTKEPGNFFGSAVAWELVASGSQLLDADTWTAISDSGTPGSTVNNLVVFVWAEDMNFFDVTEVDLFAGSTTRTWNPKDPAADEAECQRHCHVMKSTRTYGYRQSTNVVGFVYTQYSVPMRATPAGSHNVSAWSNTWSPGTTTCGMYNAVTNAAVQITGALTFNLVMLDREYWGGSFVAGTSFNGSAGDVGIIGFGADVLIIFSADL